MTASETHSASETRRAGEAHSAAWVAEALREHDELALQAKQLPNPHDGHAKGSPQPLPGTVREEQVLERIDRARRSRARVKEQRITMSHGPAARQPGRWSRPSSWTPSAIRCSSRWRTPRSCTSTVRG